MDIYLKDHNCVEDGCVKMCGSYLCCVNCIYIAALGMHERTHTHTCIHMYTTVCFKRFFCFHHKATILARRFCVNCNVILTPGLYNVNIRLDLRCSRIYPVCRQITLGIDRSTLARGMTRWNARDVLCNL